MVGTGISKGERLAAQIRAPEPDFALPEPLTQTQVIAWDPDAIDLVACVWRILDDSPSTETGCRYANLASLAPPLLGCSDLFRSIKFRSALQKRVAECGQLESAYDTLIRSIVAPHILHTLDSGERIRLSNVSPSTSGAYSFPLRYQCPPSLRIHPSGSPLFTRPHRDLEYGHQPGEVNLWLPLTDTKHPPDAATLHVETRVTEDGDHADYAPVRLAVGQMLMFHGVVRHHRVFPNATAGTRVSLDFRVAPSKCFDNGWRIPGLKIVHGMKEFCFEWRESEAVSG
ncbi:hypothetical protein BC830DRAFT_428702 [Chytriomyces sp. MP71]|nr:hypothetical protein BC830DRAFT_428702 [Chytriomyces sp. MP71]